VPAVLVCHCKVVTDRQVRAVIDAGARDEFDIAETCGAGGICGGCVPAISALLAERGCAAGCPIPALRPAAVPAAQAGAVRA
jgi:bacterioferritin-associated ferredoxin